MSLEPRELAALIAIKHGSVHGFDIFERTNLTIYETAPTLAQLERRGLISSCWSTDDCRARYHITPAGEAEFARSGCGSVSGEP